MGSTAVMNGLLGWLKALAVWILGLFDLAGTSGFSPLKWLSDHWLVLLIVLLTAGVVLDFLVWLVRWRPYWAWFRKKHIVIDDENFFAGEDLVDSGLYDPSLFQESRPRRRIPSGKRGPHPGAAPGPIPFSLFLRIPPGKIPRTRCSTFPICPFPGTSWLTEKASSMIDFCSFTAGGGATRPSLLLRFGAYYSR